MTSDETWYDITAVTSAYEEQMSSSGKRRHRERDPARARGFADDSFVDPDDWTPGAAPDHAAVGAFASAPAQIHNMPREAPHEAPASSADNRNCRRYQK